MPRISGIASKRRWPVAVATVAILTATLSVGAFPGYASAEEHGRGHREYHHRDRDWNGGYYRAPPVVYGTPYYAPPLIYGPPGLSINIR
jgi:hypothetical protein